MNTLRTLLVVGVVGAVGYGVLHKLTRNDPAQPAGGAPQPWPSQPTVEVPGSGSPGTSFGSDAAVSTAPPAVSVPGFGGTGPSDPAAESTEIAAAAPSFTPSGTSAAHEHHSHAHHQAGHSHSGTADPGTAGVGGAMHGSQPSGIGPLPAARDAAPPKDSTGVVASDDGVEDAPSSLSPGGSGASGFSGSPGGEANAAVAHRVGDRYASLPALAGVGSPTGSVGAGNAHDGPAVLSEATPDTSPTTGEGSGLPGFEAALAAVESLLAQEQLAEAHLALSQLYEEPLLSSQQRAKLLGLLGRIAGTVVYSRQHHFLERPHEVLPGETLESVAQSYHVPWQLIAKINGTEGPLEPGQTLKVVRGPFRARINLSREVMTVWLGERYAGSFPMDLSQTSAQAGEYRVVEKIPATDPQNRSGADIIELDRGVRIHGVASLDEPSGGIAVSPGDAEDLTAILSVGSRVTIRR